MFTLLVGCPPFWHRKQMVMLRNIMEGKYSFTSPEWADISGKWCKNAFTNLRFQLIFLIYFAEDPKDLIRKCLVVEPEKRITVKEALAHPFFTTTVRCFFDSNSLFSCFIIFWLFICYAIIFFSKKMNWFPRWFFGLSASIAIFYFSIFIVIRMCFIIFSISFFRSIFFFSLFL